MIAGERAVAASAGIPGEPLRFENGRWGLVDPELQSLKACGLNLYACAYGARRRSLLLSDKAAFAGLTVVSDMIAATDRFVSFN